MRVSVCGVFVCVFKNQTEPEHHHPKMNVIEEGWPTVPAVRMKDTFVLSRGNGENCENESALMKNSNCAHSAVLITFPWQSRR